MSWHNFTCHHAGILRRTWSTTQEWTIKPEKDESTNNDEDDDTTEALSDDEFYDETKPLTAENYGQPGKGAIRELAIKRTLGSSALSIRDATSSLKQSTTRANSKNELSAIEEGHSDELPPPEPGRLRLLSGITASFEPGSMTALMVRTMKVQQMCCILCHALT